MLGDRMERTIGLLSRAGAINSTSGDGDIPVPRSVQGPQLEFFVAELARCTNLKCGPEIKAEARRSALRVDHDCTNLLPAKAGDRDVLALRRAGSPHLKAVPEAKSPRFCCGDQPVRTPEKDAPPRKDPTDAG